VGQDKAAVVAERLEMLPLGAGDEADGESREEEEKDQAEDEDEDEDDDDDDDDEGEWEWPDDMLCPISWAPMDDPVIAADGHTYQREAIEEWITRRQTGQVIIYVGFTVYIEG
jgi:hypothetical protein